MVDQVFGAAMDGINNMANMIYNSEMNRIQRVWNAVDWHKNNTEWQRRYDLQRRDSLAFYQKQKADALAQWNRQNEYDSVQAQMGRFKSAGLNPNLVYGQMAHGATMQNVSAPAVPNPSPAPLSHTELKRAPLDFSATAALLGGLETRALQNELLGAQKAYSNEQTRGLQLDNDKKQRDLEHYDEDRMNSLKRTRLELSKLQSDINLTDKQKEKIGEEIAILSFEIEKQEERFNMEKTASEDRHQAALEDSGYKFDANQRANAESALNTWVAEVKNHEASVTKRTFENLAWAAYPDPDNEAERTYIIKGLYTAENIFSWLERILPKFRFEKVLKRFQFLNFK